MGKIRSSVIVPTLLILMVIITIASPTIFTTHTNPTTIRGNDSYNLRPLYYSSIPVLPNTTRSWKNIKGGYVNVYGSHSSEPAPMGIADYGIGPNGAYTLETTQWLGVVYLSSPISSNTTCVSFQLNVNLHYVANGITYDLWVQNVMRYDEANSSVFFIDNIWNYTAPYANVTSLLGNGNYGYIRFPNGQVVIFYYDWAFGNPGSPLSISTPYTVYLLVNVTTNSLGEPVINFYYNDGLGWVLYDSVTVTNAQGASQVYFLVDGFQYNGWGDYWDAELVMGGPYGGLESLIYSGTVYLQLFYWNGHNFQEIENAYNFGSDTAETVIDVTDSVYYFPDSGELLAGINGGTTGTLGLLWDQNTVTVIQVNSPIYSGYIRVYNYSIPFSESSKIPESYFTGGEYIQTLVPMDYSILIYQNNVLTAEGYAQGSRGSYVVVNAEQFSISVTPIIQLNEGQSTTITLNIIGEGPVYLNISSPIQASLSQYYLFLNGQGSDELTITAPQSLGSYTITIYANFLNGYLITKSITVNIITIRVPITFYINVIGQPLPTSPTVTFEFPNGTITDIPISSGETIYVPLGTTYDVQQVIGSGDIRWASPTQVSGVINSSSTMVTVTYYQQFLVTFSFEVQGGSNYPSPQVQYIYFGQKQTITAPSNVWVDADTQYTYQSVLQNTAYERWVDFSPSGVVTSPGTISAYYYNEYYVTVNSPIQINAYINGTEEPLTSGWYIQGTTISIINQTEYINPQERIVITSVSPSLEVVVNSPINLKVNTLTQYYVTVESPIPLYALINGTNETFSSGWYNANTEVQVENITYYPSRGERFIITFISPETFTINSPQMVTVKVLEQFYVNVSSLLPIYALINGTNETLRAGWYNANTSIEVENITHYVSNDIRYVITYISPESFKLSSPETIIVKYLEQFYVKVTSQLPIYALINGTNETLRTGWYNANTSIRVENITYYPSKGERIVLTYINLKNFVLDSPQSIETKFLVQFYVNVSSIVPLYAFVNGTNMTLESGWYNANTSIKVENITYYVVPGEERYVMVKINLVSFTVDKPFKVIASFIKQYYINVSSNMPIKAYVNGTETILNSSWINAGSIIKVINYTYYVTPEERLVPTYIPPTVVVNSSYTINVPTVTQYLVTINGVSSWYNKGSTITLKANVPFYMVGEFVGTYNVSVGSTITVNSPINETLVESINVPVVGSIAGAVIVVIAVVIGLMMRKRI
ncbi:MAG: thermopsin [Sulfolobaceae archaeon]|nr:thermopsin [Sulfolobaceae archaeon]